MGKTRGTLAALAAFLAIVIQPAGAITGNYQKDFTHDFVGLAVFYDANGDFSHRCSGSLVSTTLFVTAGHCTAGVSDARIYFQQDAGANFDPALGYDPVSGYPLSGGVTGTAYNYGFDNFAGFPNTRDAGVVILDASYSTVSGDYGELPAAGLLDQVIVSSRKKDVRFTVSGYGLSDVSPFIVSFRERLMAESQLVQTKSAITDGYNLQTSANAAQGKGGTCFGDSGGPIFLKGTNTIVAVTSFGYNGQCAGADFSYRLDRQEVLNWITGPHGS